VCLYKACEAHALHYIPTRGRYGTIRFLDTVSTKTRFLEKVTEFKMCVLIFPTAFVGNISHSKKNSAKYYQKCIQVFMKNTRLFSLTDFSKILKYQILWKSVYWEPCCFTWTDIRMDRRTDRQTDMTKLTVFLAVLRKRPETNKQYEMWMENWNSTLLTFPHSGIPRQSTSNVVRPVER